MIVSMTPNILSILIWLPILGGILILSTGGDRNAQLARKIALGVSGGTFLLSLSLWWLLLLSLLLLLLLLVLSAI